MYCICVNGGALNKQNGCADGRSVRRSYSCDSTGCSEGGPAARLASPSNRCVLYEKEGAEISAALETSVPGPVEEEASAVHTSRCRLAERVGPDRAMSAYSGQALYSNLSHQTRPHRQPDVRDNMRQSTSSSTSSTSTTTREDAPHFSRRRQSLVEALSNPLPTCVRSDTTQNLCVQADGTASNNIALNSRPSSSVVAGQQHNPVVDSEHRLFAVGELLRCERDYVSLLAALNESFLKSACRHANLFDAESLRAIFGNVRQLKSIHEKLLADLEIAAAKKPVCFGVCFLQHVCARIAYEAYSHYCNNHQRSCRRLSQLYEQEVYKEFFEQCRIVARLPALRLDAFLLRPVQQLCRYPLLLATLLQSTPKTHRDYKNLSTALQATQQLLTVVNNRRRLFEQLQELARWQKTVVDWKGPDLLQTSSRLVYNGELGCTCFALTETDGVPRWRRKRVMVFLFDRLLVLCIKDRQSKQLTFRSRYNLDGTNKACLLNGGSWQLTAPAEGKRLLFKASSKQEAKLWLEALNKERFVVQQTGRLPTSDEKMLAIEMAREQ